MSMQNPYQTYQQNSVNTATPGELTLMLYNGCLKFIHRARKAMEEQNIEQKNDNMQRVQAIIRELMAGLDENHALSQNLYTLYEYMHHRSMEANIQNDPAILDEVEQYVTDFRDTWKEALQIQRQEQHGSGANHAR